MKLDDAYANGAYIPGAEAYPARWRAAAEEWVRGQTREGRAELGLPYGTGARQVFDLFHPPGEARGLMVFVHGGYWLRFEGRDWSHLAAGAQARGWAVAVLTYDLCPQVRIGEITRQVARAITVAAQRVAGPLVLSGHSAGGHLVARMVEVGLLDKGVAARLQKLVPISPLGDLRPLLEISMNADLRLNPQEAAAESPVLMHNRHQVAVTVWVGADERPAFIAQARGLAEAWDCDLVIAPERHHFDVVAPLSDPKSDLTAALCGP